MNTIIPLFSILIPTVNRPELVVDAISSVLLQNCPTSAYELIVSNNGGCIKTKMIVEAFQKNYSIRYIEPETKLNMPDHWEWASKQLKGKYVIILPDRRMLRQSALLLMSHLINKNVGENVEVITWPDAELSESGILAPNGEGKGFVCHESKVIIRKLTQSYLDNTILPLAYNSCVKREVLEKIRFKRGRVYLPISPDFSSAFSILCVVENVFRSNDYLTITQGYRHSNGGQTISGNNSYFHSLNEEDRVFKYVPITDLLVWSSIYEDFFRSLMSFDKPLEWIDFNPVIFYKCCWQEILLRQFNEPRSSQVKILKVNFQAALDRETPDRKLSVQMEIEHSIFWPLNFKCFLVKLIGNATATKLRATFHKLRGEKIYDSGLEASGFVQPYFAAVSHLD